jgi:excisionase family DNA binding protein
VERACIRHALFLLSKEVTMTKRHHPEPRERRRLIDLHLAAEMLGCSTRTIRRKVSAGELSGFQAGPRLLRVDEAEVTALIEAARIPTASSTAA